MENIIVRTLSPQKYSKSEESNSFQIDGILYFSFGDNYNFYEIDFSVICLDETIEEYDILWVTEGETRHEQNGVYFSDKQFISNFVLEKFEEIIKKNIKNIIPTTLNLKGVNVNEI